MTEPPAGAESDVTSTAPPVSRATLADGYSVSRIIKGGWQLSGGHGDIADNAAQADMAAFVAAGITTFDCADIYTGVEGLIGSFLRSRRTHGQPSNGVQVHTKCVPDLSSLDRLTADQIADLVHRSCERLGVSVLDLVQLHWWDLTRGDPVQAAVALQELHARGTIRHVGVTNFDTPTLTTLLDAGVPVVSHQVQYSLLDRRPAGAMSGLAAARNVPFLCYGALAGGFFHERWLGVAEPIGALENRSLVKYKLIIDECGGWSRFQQLLAVLAEIAAEHEVALGTIAIAWVLAQPSVAAVIVGARNQRHVASTVAADRVVLRTDDFQRIAAWHAAAPSPPGDVYTLERDREGPHGRIMRYNLNAS